MTIEMEQQRQCCAMEASTRSATAAMPGTQVYHPPAIHPTAECAHQPPCAAGTTEPFGDRQQCRCYREGAWDIREDRFYTSGTVSASFFMWCVCIAYSFFAGCRGDVGGELLRCPQALPLF